MLDEKLSSAKPRPKHRNPDRNINRMIVLALMAWCVLWMYSANNYQSRLYACYRAVD